MVNMYSNDQLISCTFSLYQVNDVAIIGALIVKNNYRNKDYVRETMLCLIDKELYKNKILYVLDKIIKIKSFIIN